MKAASVRSFMKNFFTSMLGAFVALVIFTGGCFLLVIGVIAAIAAMGGAEKAAPDLERGSYLVFDLSANISDAPELIDFGSFGGRSSTLQLRTITRALRAAARDDRIVGVFLTGELTPAAFGSATRRSRRCGRRWRSSRRRESR